MEFFLDGHIRAYEEIKGVARKNWYDNTKLVVIRRKPEIALNTQFVDFSCHYPLCHPCLQPGKSQRKRTRGTRYKRYPKFRRDP